MSSSIDTKQVFDGLVKNAIQFLEESIRLFDSDNSQQSVINFATAVELFLKARLLLEHWTLILNKPEQADLTAFNKADFISVGQGKAIERLRKAVGLKMPKPTQKAFEDICKHRNKMVHFYHPEYHDPSNKEAKEEIAILEIRGWAHLYILATRLWLDVFIPYQEAFEKINERMKSHRVFIDGKYEALKPFIDKSIQEGKKYSICLSCSHLSSLMQLMEEGDYPVLASLCQVCFDSSPRLEVECTECNHVNFIGMYDQNRVCQNCGASIEMDRLVADYAMGIVDSEVPPFGYCEECAPFYADQSTVVLRDFGEYDRFLCLSCFTFYDDMELCDTCGVRIAGDNPWATITGGCFRCSPAAVEKELGRKTVRGHPRLRRKNL